MLGPLFLFTRGRFNLFVQKLSTILNIALRESGIDRAVHQNKALFLWETVVGKTVAKNCVAHEVQRNGVLIVKATTPVWRNEIALKKKATAIKY